MFKIEFTANTADELHGAIREATGARFIEGATDDELLEALRARFRPKGMIVNVEPFDTTAVQPQPQPQPPEAA